VGVRRRGREQGVGGAALETGEDVPIQAQSGQGRHDDRKGDDRDDPADHQTTFQRYLPAGPAPPLTSWRGLPEKLRARAIMHRMHPLLALDLTTAVLVIVAVLAVVLLILIIVAPWQQVRREPPLDKAVEAKLLLNRNPDEPTGEVPRVSAVPS